MLTLHQYYCPKCNYHREGLLDNPAVGIGSYSTICPQCNTHYQSYPVSAYSDIVSDGGFDPRDRPKKRAVFIYATHAQAIQEASLAAKHYKEVLVRATQTIVETHNTIFEYLAIDSNEKLRGKTYDYVLVDEYVKLTDEQQAYLNTVKRPS